MLSILISVLMLVAQGIPALPGQSGTISGTLRTESGEPAAGIRVAALMKPDNPLDIVGATALAGIAETDDRGQFHIENISPGFYYVTAGRVDGPTYFPGTQDIVSGKEIRVAAGSSVSGIDFAIRDTSIRPLVSALGSAITIPVDVQSDDGSRFPVLSNGKFAVLRLKSASNSMELPLAPAMTISVGVMGNYRVSVENLLDGYAVKSLTYGSVDLTAESLKIISKSVNTPASVPLSILGVAGTPILQIATQTGIALTTAMPSARVSVVLAEVAGSTPGNSGVRISGRSGSPAPRSVYLSGTPGIVYSDNTYEFRGVFPGRYSIATVGSNTKNMAASLVVGDKDIAGVDLAEVATLPVSFNQPAPPVPAGGNLPGPVSMASVHGRVLEKVTQQPIAEGSVQLTGYRSVAIPIGPDGSFETPALLPGSYEIELQIFGHEHIHQTLVVGDENVEVVLSSARLY